MRIAGGEASIENEEIAAASEQEKQEVLEEAMREEDFMQTQE